MSDLERERQTEHIHRKALLLKIYDANQSGEPWNSQIAYFIKVMLVRNIVEGSHQLLDSGHWLLDLVVVVAPVDLVDRVGDLLDLLSVGLDGLKIFLMLYECNIDN